MLGAEAPAERVGLLVKPVCDPRGGLLRRDAKEQRLVDLQGVDEALVEGFETILDQAGAPSS